MDGEQAAEARAAHWAGRAADTTQLTATQQQLTAAELITAAAVASLRGVKATLLLCCGDLGLTLPAARASLPPLVRPSQLHWSCLPHGECNRRSSDGVPGSQPE